MMNKDEYEDIINMEHPVSTRHPQMSMLDRAAQFSPFAALTGYDAAVKETARLTDARIELDENSKALLNEKLQMLQESLDEKPEVTIIYFLPDEKKAGGEYVSITGIIKKIDGNKREIIMTDGGRVPIEEIYGIEGALFARV